MKIVDLKIRNFRCIKELHFCPSVHNVFLGPNNVGKTAILEAMNLLLNPEVSVYSHAIDENDFHDRRYRSEPSDAAQLTAPTIRVEAVLSDLTQDDQDHFRDHLVPWNHETSRVVESSEEGTDPFAGAQVGIRVFFEGWYSEEDDAFYYETYFLPQEGLDRDHCRSFGREHKRRIGFLIYRDFRALTRPITLESASLFGVLLKSQDAQPKNFEPSLERLGQVLDSLHNTPSFSTVLSAFKQEMERYLTLCEEQTSDLAFQLTDGTRDQVKAAAQLHVIGKLSLPLQSMGAGTRSLAILAMLTLIMRKRGRGILALEEPETFLFPHAQRRVLDECIDLSTQSFITTHSPYVLERVPVSGVVRVTRRADGNAECKFLLDQSIRDINHFSKTLKQVQCEALVGRGVIVVEGESDRCWIQGASRIYNSQTFHGQTLESLDLFGVAVVSAEGNGGIQRYGKFFAEAGLKVLGLYDHIDNEEMLAPLIASPFSNFQLRYAGLEQLLSEELSTELLRNVLVSAPYSRSSMISASTIISMSDSEVRSAALRFLGENKGTIALHEWILSLLDGDGIPNTLKSILWMSNKYFTGTLEIGRILTVGTRG
jgi:putative ATP-dependent endonuclease of the OLD family